MNRIGGGLIFRPQRCFFPFGILTVCVFIEWRSVGKVAWFRQKREFFWFLHLNAWHITWSKINGKQYEENHINNRNHIWADYFDRTDYAFQTQTQMTKEKSRCKNVAANEVNGTVGHIIYVIHTSIDWVPPFSRKEQSKLIFLSCTSEWSAFVLCDATFPDRLKRSGRPFHLRVSVCVIVTTTDLIEFTERKASFKKQAPATTIASTWDSFLFFTSSVILVLLKYYSFKRFSPFAFFLSSSTLSVIQSNTIHIFSSHFALFIMLKTQFYRKKNMWCWGWVLNETFSWKRYLASLSHNDSAWICSSVLRPLYTSRAVCSSYASQAISRKGAHESQANRSLFLVVLLSHKYGIDSVMSF